MKRWDIMQGRDNGGKTYWNKVGVLFAGNDGKMWMELNALPIGDSEGRVRCQVFEPRQQSDSNRSEQRGAPVEAMDDSIPF